MVSADTRWCIWIDIEGFGARYAQEALALRALRRLVVGVYRIGTHVYPEPGQRLFAHQFGDGVAVLSEGHEDCLERCACIATALLRDVSEEGFFARAGIAEGDFADVGLPREIRAADRDGEDDRTHMGHGLLTTTQVMGTALIAAVKMQEARPKGPLLLCGSEIARRIPDTFSRCQPSGRSPVLALDWVRSSSPEIGSIQAKSGLAQPGEEALSARLRQYCEAFPRLSRRWKHAALRLSDGPPYSS